MNTARVVFASDSYSANYSLSTGNDYILFISSTSLQLSKRSGGIETTLKAESISGLSGNWQHIDITKDASDQILVKINGMLHFNVTDSNVIDSVLFKLVTNEKTGLDNVTVTDSVDTTTTTTPTTTTTTTSSTPGFDSVTAIIFLISSTTLIGFLRHRKKIKD
jgi:hypothetical protein